MKKLIHTKFRIQDAARIFGILSLSMLCLLAFPNKTMAQNTPLATAASQNPDGTTDVAGTPMACASGFNIYTIDHEDIRVGSLPGGFCIATELVNNGTSTITASAQGPGAGEGDLDGIVVGGGRINYLSNDGEDADAIYNFCAPLTNPYVFIGEPETGTTINFFDCDNNPININLINGEDRFSVTTNSASITGTTIVQRSGYVQVPGTFSCLKINISNGGSGGADGIRIGLGVCMPDPPVGNQACPYDLFMWKTDKSCIPVYRDSEGVFYEKDQNNNNIASIGDELFIGSPICGSLEFLEGNAVDDINCEPEFTCDAAPIKISFLEPDANASMYYTEWGQDPGFTINNPDPGNTWRGLFSATDGFGLPAHPSVPAGSGTLSNISYLGDDSDIDDGGQPDEQAQFDAWLFVPPQALCVNFRVGFGSPDHSIGLYVGTGLNAMEFIAEENDNQAGFPNNGSGVTGVYCIPAGVAITSDDCGWQVLRVRIYAHDDHTFYDAGIDWSFNGGLTWNPVPGTYVQGATSATDNTPPTGALATNVENMFDVLQDEAGNYWNLPGNCENNPIVPTNLWEPPTSVGSHISLSPFCINIEESEEVCDPCLLDFEELGCICDNPLNDFQDVPAICPQTNLLTYKQELIVTSTNTSYTISGSTGIVGGTAAIQGPFPVFGSGGADQLYTYFVTPGVAYSITIGGDQTGVSKTFAGECPIPDDCNCPVSEEKCGDGLDNDCDGLVDADDPDVVGDCILTCDATSVEVQGKELITDGKLTHQVWSRECNNTECCRSSINPHSCALAPFTGTDVNGLPKHQIPVAGCTGNDAFNTLGSIERANPQFFSLRPEQVQLDGWLVLPPGVECFSLKVNHPRAWDAQAVYMGPGIASMNFVGASSFPPTQNYTSDSQDGSGECNGTTQGSAIYSYDTKPATGNGTHETITVDGWTWTLIRVRAYIFDESFFHVTPVQWNIGEGFVNIPSKFLQSVGPDGWDTDGNKPTEANAFLTAPFCAFLDADGDLFLPNGEIYTLDLSKCETLMDNVCLTCPPNLYDCLDTDECVPSDPAIVDGEPAMEMPMCPLEVFEVTPKVIIQPNGGGLLTRYWDHNDGSCTNNEIINESIFCAFSGYTEGPCPGCLPEHPNFDNPTGTLTLGRLGVRSSDMPQDIDDDNFVIGAINRRSGENAQQDGWLLIPPDVTCIQFRISSLAWDAGAIYLGPNINEMTLVGENVNARGENPIDTFYYEVPQTAAPLACDGCEGDLRFLRVRTYHHDNNMFANTEWQWNIGNGFVNVPASNLFPVENHCDNDPPSTCPTIEDGTPFLAVKDVNGKWFNYNGFPNPTTFADITDQKLNQTVARIEIDPCADINPVCDTPEDNKGVCQACFQCPTIGTIMCSTPRPVITRPFNIEATGLENMAMMDNGETNFGIIFVLHPGENPPADPYDLTGATVLGTVPFSELSNGGASAILEDVVLPSDFPQGPYFFSAILTPAPTLDVDCRPFAQGDTAKEVIPTIGQWGLLILGLLLASMAVVRLRNRKESWI